MAISELAKAMANLRLSLAEIQNKERQLDSLISQFRTQLRRLPRQVIYGGTSLEASLAAMGEIQERLEDAVGTRNRLLAIKKTALEELEALEVLKQVDEARRSLVELKRRVDAEDGAGTEVRRLERFIADNSKRAEQAITSSFQERVDGA